MSDRLVTGALGPEWASSPVIFSRRQSTWTPERHRLIEAKVATTDASGNFGILLWPNTEGATPSHYSCTLPDEKHFPFVLEPGGPVSIEELRTQAGVAEWTAPGIGTLMDAYRAQLANTTNVDLGSSLVGHLPPGAGAVGTTVRDKLSERITLNDYIQLGDGSSIVPAYHRALAVVPVGGTIDALPGTYQVQSLLTLDKSHTLNGPGATFVVADRELVYAAAHDIIWNDVTWQGLLDDGFYRYALWKLKTLGVDATVDCRRWIFNRCTFKRIGTIFTRAGRIGPQSAALRTLTTTSLVAGSTVLHVQSTTGCAVGMHVLAGPQTDPAGQPINGKYHLSLLDAVTPGALTLTLHTPLEGALPSGRRVDEVTVLTQTATAGATTIHVASTDRADEELFARIALDNGSIHQSPIVDFDPAGLTITIEDGLPSTAMAGTWLGVYDAGVQQTSADFAGDVTLNDCHWDGAHTAYAVAFGGIDNGVIRGGRIENVWAYNVANDPGSGYSSSSGEGFKVSTGATACWIGGGLVVERVHRNAGDLYDARSVTVDGVTLRNGSPDLVTDLNPYGIYPEAGLLAGGLETKKNKTDRNIPEHFQLSNIRIERWRGYGLMVGVPLATVTGLQVAYIDGPGFYGNGGRPDVIGDDNEPLSPTNDIQIVGPIIHDCTDAGIRFTEVVNGVITGGRVTRCAVGLDLYEWAQMATVSGIDLTGNTLDLRVQGITGIEHRHIISGRWSTSSISVDAKYVLLNGFGEESGLAVGAMPTLSKWPSGATVRNPADGKIFLRGSAAWYALN